MYPERSKQDIINQWCTMDEHADVAFVSAPITYPPIPSMALSIFQATLDAAGISSKVVYTMFLAMRLLGNLTIQNLHQAIDLFKNGELLFAHLTDVPTPCTPEDIVAVLRPDMTGFEKELVLELLKHALSAADQIVEATSRKVVNMGAKILAVSSIYSQHNASLAIIRRVKELDPSITTIIGGYNVSGEAGLAVLKYFPSVDYVSFGEGDETIAEVCRNILEKNDAPMPYGVVGRNDLLPDTAPYRMTKDMDTVATPDYRDFFEEKERAMNGFYGDLFRNTGINLDTVIFLEGSRGCWWGQRKACTFCGLNGLTDVYREKSVDHFHEELSKTMQRYPGASIQLSDNVLSHSMIHNLMPKMAEDPVSYRVLGEIRTNLNSEEMLLLARAGFYCVQPGIESINDHLLQLMGKGSSAVQNIAILKYSRSFGIYPVWNMLCGMPDEERIDYEQTIELMPLIHHLYPPTFASKIQFNRFSRYGTSPAEYGIELEPADAYKLSYRGNDELTRSIGSELKLTGGKFYDVKRQNRDVYARLQKAVTEWRRLTFSEARPQLIMTETFLGILITDTRPVAPAPRVFLLGLRAAIYRLAWEPVTFKKICDALPDVSEDDIRSCLDELVSQKLMIFMSGRYLALAADLKYYEEKNKD